MNTVWWLGMAAALLLTTIWLGYPLYLWTRSLTTRRPLRPDAAYGASRHVSVVLATRDDTQTLAGRIANLLDTDHPAGQLEVLVALDAAGATADGVLLETIDPRVHVVHGDAPGGKAAALNAGVRAATGEIVVLADARQRFDRNTIPALAAALADKRFGAVSGALDLGGSGTPAHWYWRLEKWIRHREALIHSTIGVTGAVYAVRRSLWPVIPAGTLLDDLYVPMSLLLRGHRIGFTYDARAVDVRAFDAAGERVRKTRTSTGLLQLRTLLPEAFSVRQNPVWVWFMWHKYLRLLTPVLSSLLVLSVAVWGLGVAGRASREALLVAGALAAGALLIAPVRRRVVSGISWFSAINASLVRAVLNGVRSKWHVWHSQ